MGFPRQEYWSGLPCSPPGDLLDPGTEPMSLMSHALADRFFTTRTTCTHTHTHTRARAHVAGKELACNTGDPSSITGWGRSPRQGIGYPAQYSWASLVALMNPLGCRRPGFNPWVGKIPWRRAWQPTPVFLSEESHGQRSLVGYSPCDCKELDMTDQLRVHTHTPASSSVDGH